MKKLWWIISLFLLSCNEKSEADRIVDHAIERAGGTKFETSTISFLFRSRSYSYQKVNGNFKYSRTWSDSTGVFYDQLTNQGFSRKLNGVNIAVPDTMAVKYSNSINSVIYFALLPYGLNDPAVNKEYIGDKNILGKEYYKIRVTFDKKGGGADYQDTYYYWVNKKNYDVDYLAYDYKTDGGGMRFREVSKHKIVGGIRFADYINYEPTSSIPLAEIDNAFVEGHLKKLSTIILENIIVNPI